MYNPHIVRKKASKWLISIEDERYDKDIYKEETHKLVLNLWASESRRTQLESNQQSVSAQIDQHLMILMLKQSLVIY